MSNVPNPYAVGSTIDPMQPQQNMRLASLGSRFVGALIDGFIGLIFVGPGYAMIIASTAMAENGGEPPAALAMGGIVLTLLGAVALLGTQIYLLATRSQTIGKVAMKMQIVDFETGQRASFVSSFVLRLLVNGIIGAIPCIGPIYTIVDICFIFREDRRCVHDLIAKTCVVDIS